MIIVSNMLTKSDFFLIYLNHFKDEKQEIIAQTEVSARKSVNLVVIAVNAGKRATTCCCR